MAACRVQEGSLSSAAQPSRIEQLLAEVDWVRDLARALLGSAREADVDDVVQETMIRAIQSPPRADGPVRGWLATVLRNVWRQQHRTDGRRARRESHSDTPDAPPTPEESVLLAERQHVVVGAVLALPEPYRHTITMRFFDGLTEAEIAAAECVSRSTVQSRVRRGLELLKDEVRQRYGKGWVAALLPLALWPDRVPPVPTASGPVPRGLPAAAIASVAAVVGLIAAGIWWGDWWVDVADPAAAVADAGIGGEGVAGATRRRVEVGGGRRRSAGPQAGAGATESIPATLVVPLETPVGSVRVRLNGFEPGADTRTYVEIQPLQVRAWDLFEGLVPEPRTVEIDAATVDLDLGRIFGDVDILDVDVTLHHPGTMPQTVRCVPAGPGEAAISAEFDISPAAVVVGRILDADGVPVAGADVLAGQDQDLQDAHSVRTVVDEARADAEGRFRLCVPPRSRIAVIAQAPGHEAGWREVMALDAGEEVPVDLALERGATISGRVLLPGGESGEGLHVVATLHRYVDRLFRGREQTAVLDGGRAIQKGARCAVASDGTFALHGLSPCEYRVSVERPAWDASAHRDNGLAVCAAPSATLELEQRLVRVPFVVRDADGGPLAGARVSALDSELLGAQPAALTDASGRATLELRPGVAFGWTVGAPWRATTRGELTVPSGGPAEAIRVDFPRPPDATWRVRLRHADGTPVRQAAFRVRSPSTGVARGLAQELSSPDGEFVVTGLERGLHEIGIRVGACWSDTRTYWPETAREVTVPSSGPVETIVLGKDVLRGGRLRIDLVADGDFPVFGVLNLTRSADGSAVPCSVAVRQYASLTMETPSLFAGRPNYVQPPLPPGTYEVRVERTNPAPRLVVTRTVTIQEGRTTPLDVDLTAR